MTIDIYIKNGHVIDPSQDIDQVMDLAVVKGHIVPVPDMPFKAVKTVNAEGYYVFPGLIDFHTHIFYRGNEDSANPDYMLATGVTAAVDAGSAGWTNYEAFYRNVLLQSRLKIKSYLSITDFGVDFTPESYLDKDIHSEKIKEIFAQYGDHLLGLKVRAMKGLIDDIHALDTAVALAEHLEKGICVHVTNPPCPEDDIADRLRAGDVFCHMYHGNGATILGPNKKVTQGIRNARERGVLFDMANGRGNFCFETAIAAMADGFLPDIVSTDMTSDKMNYNFCAKNLPYVMSKMLQLGMTIPQIIKAVTETPAKIMGLDRKSVLETKKGMWGGIGTLANGACADIAIFDIKGGTQIHRDFRGDTMEIERYFYPLMTIVDGEIAFCQVDFNNL